MPPKSDEKVEDLLGQHLGKFDYKVFYSKPPSYDIPIESIVPGGWGDEFDDAKPVSEENKNKLFIQSYVFYCIFNFALLFISSHGF